MNFVEELKWRGMVHDMMPGTEEQLQKELTCAPGRCPRHNTHRRGRR